LSSRVLTGGRSLAAVPDAASRLAGFRGSGLRPSHLNQRRATTGP